MPVDTVIAAQQLVNAPLTLGLYVVTPGGEMAAVASGYEPCTIPPAAWETTEGGIVRTEWTFMFTAPTGRVDGYYLAVPSGEWLDTQELSDGPVHVEIPGSTLKVRCELQVKG